jgi:hypothetical protein
VTRLLSRHCLEQVFHGSVAGYIPPPLLDELRRVMEYLSTNMSIASAPDLRLPLAAVLSVDVKSQTSLSSDYRKHWLEGVRGSVDPESTLAHELDGALAPNQQLQWFIRAGRIPRERASTS